MADPDARDAVHVALVDAWPSDDVVLFHDEGNDAARYATLVDELTDRGAAFADPLALV